MHLLISELSPDRLARIERRLRPGAASATGFLAPGERLAAVIARDAETLRALRVTPEQIADRLESIAGAAYRLSDLARRGRLQLDQAALDGFRHRAGPGITVGAQF